MDRSQDGTATSLGAGPVPAGGGAIAPLAGYAAEGRAVRPEGRRGPSPTSVLRNRTATCSAARDTGSALRRRRTPDPDPPRFRGRTRDRLLNANTEILR